jgi:cytochrome c oxidase assembly protein subunit 11
MLTSDNRRVALICSTVVVAMLGLAYASVPLYRLFCQVTGFGGTTMRTERASTQTIDRTVTVRFDANVGPGLPWDFQATQPTVVVRLGENAMVTYRATNRSDKPMVGTSTFNVTPEQSGAFFNKLECFCFTEQRLEPGESIDMPVSFFVDPAMAQDRDGARINYITLSYTFFPVANPQKVTGERQGGGTGRGS